MAKKEKRDFEEIFLNYDPKEKPAKVLLKMYSDNIGKLLLSNLFFFIKNLPVWIIPLITESIVNAATTGGPNTVRIILIDLLIALVVIAQNVPTHAIYIRYISNAIRDVETRLRSSLVRKLQHLSISFHKDFKSGRIQSKILRDVEAIEGLSRTIMISLVPSILTSVVSLGITVYRRPVVALFFLITIPLAVGVVTMFRKNIRQTSRNFRKEVEHMSSNVSEMVEMIPVTKAHGLGKVEIKRIDKQLEHVQDAGLRTDMVQAYFGSSSWCVFQLAQALCLAFTGYLAYKKVITVGEIMLYQSFFTSLMGNVSGIINVYPTIAKGFESIVSVGEILGAKDMENNRGKKRLTGLEGNYRFEHVSFSYPDEPDAYVLKDFNLEVKKGECIAFVGESGAGKSTILNLLIGFNFPTKGRVLVDGNDITDVHLTTYRNHIAVVPQTNILFSGTIRDNITYGLQSITNREVQKVIDMANLRDVIDRLPDGVDTSIGEHGGRLSGGQRQRIAIARAMIRKPDVIILDEATSALDNVSEFKVQSAMEQLIKDRTTFIVAHRLSTIRNADRIVVMKDGQCVEMGTYDELLKKEGEFYKLSKLQSR